MGVTRRVLTLVNLILLTAGVFFSVQIFYRVLLIDFNHMSKPSGNQRTKSKASEASIFPLSYYHIIPERRLFGIQDSKEKTDKAPDAPTDEDWAKTDLNIRLWGTITEKDGTAYAVIESTSPQSRRSEQQLFKEGQKVLNAEIEKVYRDKVLLNVEGEQQVLPMEKYQSRSPARALRRRTRQPVSLTRTIQKKKIDESFENINEIMGQALIRSHAKGLVISRIKRGSIFQYLGLRNGDIIDRVNDRRIRSVDDALSFYNSLKSASQVRLALRRRGRPYNITYRIR